MTVDVSVKRIDEMQAHGRGIFVTVGNQLGISSFGINVERWPADCDRHPEHDEAGSGQEEIYLPLSGSCVLIADGEEFLLEPGVFARVGAGQRRRIVTRDDPVDLLCIGGIPGEVFRASGPAAG
jgi:uncharacterized cupin superfamily protein